MTAFISFWTFYEDLLSLMGRGDFMTELKTDFSEKKREDQPHPKVPGPEVDLPQNPDETPTINQPPVELPSKNPVKPEVL